MKNTQSPLNQQSTKGASEQKITQNNIRLFVVIAISILLTVIITGWTVYFWQKLANGKEISNLKQEIVILKNQLSQVHDTATKPTQADESIVEWEKYVNPEHKISFKYPKNIFVYHDTSTPETQYWSNKPNGGAPLELGVDGVWLNMSFSDPGFTMTMFYKNIINDLAINESISQSAVTKLSNIETDGIKGATYFQGTPENFVGEKAYSYEAVWIKGENVYRLSLSAFSKQRLKEYKKTFDQILSTFKFTN